MVLRPDILVTMKRIEIVIDEKSLDDMLTAASGCRCAWLHSHQEGGRAGFNR
jgi:hypothetical protein